MRFEVYPSRSLRKLGRRQWYWRLVASNGQVVAQSEGYTNKRDAEKVCVSIRVHAKDAPVEVVSA